MTHSWYSIEELLKCSRYDNLICVCLLQFSMHANLILVNITVRVSKLPTGFYADAMKSIQEGRALVGVIIIIPVVINVMCLKCHCVFICFHQWKVLIHAVLQLVFGNLFIEV